MKTTVGRPSPVAIAFGAVLLVVFLAGSAYGLWRLLRTALDPGVVAAWMPGAILALLAAHWVIAAIARGRAGQRQALRIRARRAVVYRRALTDPDAGADLALWASAEVLLCYAEYQRARSDDPAAAPSTELLTAMRRDLGHRADEALSADAVVLALRREPPRPIETPAARPPARDLARTPFFSP